MRHHIFDHIYVILCPGRDTRAWYMYSVELGSSLRIGVHVGHMLGRRLGALSGRPGPAIHGFLVGSVESDVACAVGPEVVRLAEMANKREQTFALY
jgi:hypothetical protein